MDRGGFTKAGRGLMKHGYRPDSVFPKPIGNPVKINAHGQKVLEEILNHPDLVIKFNYSDFIGDVIDISIPGGKGGRFLAKDNSFIGFLEPKGVK